MVINGNASSDWSSARIPTTRNAEQRPTARGCGIGARVVLAGLDDPRQLARRREPR